MCSLLILGKYILKNNSTRLTFIKYLNDNEFGCSGDYLKIYCTGT